jgi:ribose transport system substrate-binding protein
MKRYLRILVLAAAASALGCGGQTSSAKTIGASLLTQTHPFYQDMVEAMTDTAKQHGFELQIQFCEFDSAKQNDHVETYMVKGVDAIVLSPTDSAGVRPVIADARSRGIPVFTVDIAAHDADVVSHIASDNVKGGRILGEYLAQLLEGKGRVIIIDNPEVASVQDRVAGFEEALAKFPDIEIVAKPPGFGMRTRALDAATDALQAHPDVDAVFGINDDSALGALAAAEAAGLADRLVIVGYDGTEEARTEIRKGSALKADTVQYPKQIGKQAIETIAAHFRGEQVPPVIPVDVGIIDRVALEETES